WNPLSVTPARLSGAPAAPPLVMPELPEMISTRCIEVLIRPSIRGGITTVRRTVFPLGGGGGGGGGGVPGPAGEDEPHPARRRAMPTASAVGGRRMRAPIKGRSEEHTSELQSRENLVCRLLLEKNKRHREPPLSG